MVLATQDQETIGTIQLDQAMREAYPGASYLHSRGQYSVSKWDAEDDNRRILLDRLVEYRRTVPNIETDVVATAGGVRTPKIRRHQRDSGYVALVNLVITDQVVGFAQQRSEDADEWDEYLYRYKEDQTEEPFIPTRVIPTTGLLLHIPKPWFLGPTSMVGKLLASGEVPHCEQVGRHVVPSSQLQPG